MNKNTVADSIDNQHQDMLEAIGQLKLRMTVDDKEASLERARVETALAGAVAQAQHYVRYYGST